ncbi:unnamed protein product, partial [Urochloa humidicola]
MDLGHSFERLVDPDLGHSFGSSRSFIDMDPADLFSLRWTTTAPPPPESEFELGLLGGGGSSDPSSPVMVSVSQVVVVAAVPLVPEHAGVAQLLLQREERRRWEAPRQVTVVVEDTGAAPPVPDAAVPEGEGAAAVVVRGEAEGGAGEPRARVHVEHGVVPRQCRGPWRRWRWSYWRRRRRTGARCQVGIRQLSPGHGGDLPAAAEDLRGGGVESDRGAERANQRRRNRSG